MNKQERIDIIKEIAARLKVAASMPQKDWTQNCTSDLLIARNCLRPSFPLSDAEPPAPRGG